MAKLKRKLALGGMALLMGISAGVSVIGTAAPAQEVEAHAGVVFNQNKKMKTPRAVYYNTKNNKGKKEAVYYKGSRYKVSNVYKNGYYKVTFPKIGTRWMHYTSVLNDQKM